MPAAAIAEKKKELARAGDCGVLACLGEALAGGGVGGDYFDYFEYFEYFELEN